MTLGERDNDDSQERKREEPADCSEGALVSTCPDGAGYALEELEYSIFGGPDAE